MAKTHRRPKMTIPVALVAGFIPTVTQALGENGWQNKLKRVGANLTGYNPWQKKWLIGDFKAGWIPLGIGILVHKFIGGSLGVNRALARAGIPFVRL